MIDDIKIRKLSIAFLDKIYANHNYKLDSVSIYHNIALITFNTKEYLDYGEKAKKQFLGPLLIDRKSGYVKQYPTSLRNPGSILGDFVERIFFYDSIHGYYPGFDFEVQYFRCRISDIKSRPLLHQYLVAYPPSGLDANGIDSHFMPRAEIYEKVFKSNSFEISSYHTDDLLKFLFFNTKLNFAKIELKKIG